MAVRLDKYITDNMNYTRKEAKSLIAKGRVYVNDVSVNRPETKVTNQDQVVIDGRLIEYEKYSYYMLYKPAGVVSATKDNLSKTVIELLGEQARSDLFPVGRLDKDTEGLLLITNDGQLSHRLLSPKKHVDKMYYVELLRPLDPKDVASFLEGIDIGEKNTLKPARLEILGEKRAMLTISEGKFHQIKRMFQVIGNQVDYLKRISMGTLVLDESLKPGEFRRLTSEEISDLGGLDG